MAAPITQMAQGVPQIQMTGLDSQTRTYAFGIAALIASCLLLAGAGWAFAAALGLEADAAALAAGAVAGVAAICGCVAFYQRGRTELVFYGVLAACVVAACIVLHGQIAAGAGQVLNAAGTVAGRYSGVYATPYQQGGTFDLAALMVVFGIVCGAACAQVALRGGTVAAIVLSIVVAVCVVLGLLPVTAWTLVFSVGVLACFVTNTARQTENPGAAVLASSLGALVAAALLIAALALGAFGVGLQTAPAGDAIRQAVYGMLYGGSYAMPQGKLTDLPALETSEKPALHVTLDAPINDYLRGFVGETYDGQSWQTLGADEVQAGQELFYWLREHGFDTNSQLASAAVAGGFGAGEAKPLSIETQGARGAYAYLPYAAAGGEGYTSITDLSTTRVSDGTALQTGYQAGLLSKAYLVQDKIDAAQKKATPELTAYLDDEAAYAAYAKEHYTKLDPTLANTIAAVFGKPHELDTEQAKAYVLQQLNDAISYDAKADTPNGTQDFVTYVLTQSKRGYSVHYATLATLLMRYYGIPARYVEGYKIDNATDQEGGSGDAQGDYINDFTLTEEHAHAWVEYYLDGVGWLPFEVTPGYVDYDFYEPTNKVSQQLTGSAWWNSSSMTPWTPPENEEDPQVQTAVNTASGPAAAPEPWWLAIISFIVTLAAAAAVRTRIMRGKLAAFMESLKTDDPTAATPRAFSYGLYMAQAAGADVENVPFAHVEVQEGTATGELLGTDLYRKAAQANDRALFSPQGAGEDERKAALEFCEYVKSKMEEMPDTKKRLRFKWVDCMY